MIDDDEDQLRKDLVKYGNDADKRDMARMGKIQEMRVREFTVTYCRSLAYRDR